MSYVKRDYFDAVQKLWGDIKNHVVYDEGTERFKAGTTTYTAPELAGVLEAAVDNLDDVKKQVRTKQARFTAFVKDKGLHQPKRLTSTYTPVSSTSKFKGYQTRPRVTGQDPYAFDDEPEESPETKFVTGREKRKKSSK